jgi:hypothetical protein
MIPPHRRQRSLWFFVPLLVYEHRSIAFHVFPCGSRRSTRSPISLWASSKAQNKQAALRQKMEAAKRQSSNAIEEQTGSKRDLSDEEIRQRNDRMRFEELLKKGIGRIQSEYDSDGYLSQQQEEDEIDAVRSGKDRLYEGDPAPTDCFEELVSIKSENVIGTNGKQRLVPWLRKSAARHDDYLVIISDPRQQSPDLRETIKTLLVELPDEIRKRMIVVNADSPAENRRWLKKSGIAADRLDIYADEKMEWMRSYTALGETRWSMTMFIIGNSRVRKLARDMDRYGASRTVQNAVKALDEKFVS